jgi:hypothetical protein
MLEGFIKFKLKLWLPSDDMKKEVRIFGVSRPGYEYHIVINSLHNMVSLSDLQHPTLTTKQPLDRAD